MNRINGEYAIMLYVSAMVAAKNIENDSMIAVVNLKGSIPRINIAIYDEARTMLDQAIVYWETVEDTLQFAKAFIHLASLGRIERNSYFTIRNLYKAKRWRSPLTSVAISGPGNRSSESIR